MSEAMVEKEVEAKVQWNVLLEINQRGEKISTKATRLIKNKL